MVGKQGRAWNIQGKLVKRFQLCFWGQPGGCSATEVSWWEIPGRKGAWRSCCRRLGAQSHARRRFPCGHSFLVWRIPAGRGLAASVEVCHNRTAPFPILGPEQCLLTAGPTASAAQPTPPPPQPCHVLVSPLGSGLWSHGGFAG